MDSVDAISYLELRHIFTAMMTGNTVLLGLALGQGEVQAALQSILALTGFAVGAAAGTMIVERDKEQGEWPPAISEALALEGMMLAILIMIWHLTGTERRANVVHVLIVLSGLAMGIQAAAVRRLGVYPSLARATYIRAMLRSDTEMCALKVNVDG